jgi:hypothetical protein
MTWSLSQVEGEGAKLAFGKPQSDDVLVMLTCEPRSNRLRVSAPASTNGRFIGLSSGREARRYVASAGPAGFGDGVVLEAEARPDDPVVTRFAASGQLALDVDGRRLALPADDPRQAREFVNSCRP